MFCPECGTQNPPNAKFCNECGLNLIETLKEISEISEDKENKDKENSEIEDQTANPDNTEDFDETELDKSGQDKSETNHPNIETVNPDDRCIICKTGVMISATHRGSLGIGTKNTLECNNCGAVFEKKGSKYKLTNITDTRQPIWIRYNHQTLTDIEWIRIGNGGVSDQEQQKIDAKNKAIELQKIKAQEQTDLNQFLTGLQNGSINITTSDPSPVILKKDEHLSMVMNNISMQEPRAVRQTRAAYGGPTIRVAKGVSFRMGGAAARSESHEEIKVIDQGSLILTNKRMVFIGSKRTTNIDLKKIMAITAYRDGIESQRENKQKAEYFTGTDKNNITFTVNGRQRNMPINGVVLKAAIEGAITQL
jgi:zinc-ribbon domain